jgi:hypothetical protein
MAVAVKSDNAGGKFGHMHLILKEKEYCITTKNTTATAGPLNKPPDINPKFQLLKKDKLTKYTVLQMEAKIRQKITTSLTKEKTSKNLVCWIVASIEHQRTGQQVHRILSSEEVALRDWVCPYTRR